VALPDILCVSGQAIGRFDERGLGGLSTSLVVASGDYLSLLSREQPVGSAFSEQWKVVFCIGSPSNFLKLPTGTAALRRRPGVDDGFFFCGLLLECRHFAASHKVAISRGCNSEAWERVRTLALCWSGRGFLIVSSLAGMLVTAIPFMVLHVKSLSVTSWLASITSIVTSFPPSLLPSVLILGRDRTGGVVHLFRFPPTDQRSDVNWGSPVVVTFSTAAAFLRFAAFQSQWRRISYGKYSPPMPSQYFDLVQRLAFIAFPSCVRRK